MAESKRSRIVVAPLPAQGHIPSIVNLAIKLAAQGFGITMVNIESVHQKLVKSWTIPTDLDITLESIPFRMEIPKVLDAQAASKRAALIDALNDLINPFEEVVSRLQLNSPPPICIISDYHATWTTPVAQRLNIPQICLWCGSAAWSLIEQHLPELHSGGFIPVPDDEEFHQRVISFIPGLDPFKASDLPYYFHEHNIGRSEKLLTRLLDKVPRLGSDELILVNTFHDLEPVEVEQMKLILGPKKFMAIGPLIDHSSEQVGLETEDMTCLEWLLTRPRSSVLYVSFGSLASLSTRQLEELALGLESQSFLWVIRPEFLAAAGVESDQFHKRFASRTDCLIVSWAPQQKVLSHGSVGGFLTHCGWNSTLESVWNGVPMLGWPCNSDQNVNCRLTVEGRGIGRCIPRGSREDVVHRDAVRRSVEELMECEEMRQAVQELKESARRALMVNGSSDVELQSLIKHLKYIS